MKMYVVGGAVRDVLLGRTPKDIDYVAVGSTPKEMLGSGLKAIPASSFPVFHDKDGNEIALARKERKVGNGYHGFECEYDNTVTLEDDLYRRDLRMNSMAVDIQNWIKFKNDKKIKHVIDPYGGIDDIFSGTIHHTSEFFVEDPVRALRAIRLANRYGFRIHSKTEELIRSMVHSGELDHLTPERIWLEVEKVFSDSKDAFAFFTECERLETLPKMFPNTDDLFIDDEDIRLYEKSGLQDKEYAYLAMMNTNSNQYLENFSKSMKLPSSYFRLAKGYQNVMFIINDGKLTSPEDVIRLLESLNAFQSTDLLDRVCSYLIDVENSHLKECEQLKLSLSSISDINFTMLSPAQQKLKGKAVGNAINNLRIQTLEALYRR